MIEYYEKYQLKLWKWLIYAVSKTVIIWTVVMAFLLVWHNDILQIRISDIIYIYLWSFLSWPCLVLFGIIIVLSKTEIPYPIKLPLGTDKKLQTQIYVLFNSVIFKPSLILITSPQKLARWCNNSESVLGRKLFVNSKLFHQFSEDFSTDIKDVDFNQHIANGLIGVNRQAIVRKDFKDIPSSEGYGNYILYSLKDHFASEILNVWISKSTNVIYYELASDELISTPYLYNLATILTDVMGVYFVGYEVVDFVETISSFNNDLVNLMPNKGK